MSAHVELIRAAQDDSRADRVIRRMVVMLRSAGDQPDPTIGGELVHRAMLLGAAHLGESLASPWTEEEEGDHLADEDRIERRAAA